MLCYHKDFNVITEAHVNALDSEKQSTVHIGIMYSKLFPSLS